MKKTTLIIILLYIILQAHANENTKVSPNGEKLEGAPTISLLTCYPGKQIYSLYGHTAIRYVNQDEGIDLVINYGLFDSNAPHFLAKFILGETNYTVGALPYPFFIEEYRRENRKVIEQELNLTKEEITQIVKYIDNNLRPENRSYNYNIFYKNCTTQARDAIFNNLNIQKASPSGGRLEGAPTYRSLLHQYTQDHPWIQFGTDLLLGLKADKQLTITQRQFLPIELMKQIDKFSSNQSLPLVKNKKTLIESFPQLKIDANRPAGVDFQFPTPTQTAIIVLIITIVITILQSKNIDFPRRRRFAIAFDFAFPFGQRFTIPRRRRFSIPFGQRTSFAFPFGQRFSIPFGQRTSFAFDFPRRRRFAIPFGQRFSIHITARILDTLLLIICTVAGIILTVLAISKHPTTTANLIILTLNPLPATIIYQTIVNKQNKYTKNIWTIWSILIIITLIGNIIQKYPTAFNIFAIALLIRTTYNAYTSRRIDK